MMWVNQAWAADIAIMLYEEYIQDIKDANSTVWFKEWCKRKFEEAPYDEFD